MGLSAGSRIGAYEVVAKLGEGGMGEVYRARDTSLGRDVAIKVLPASVAGDPERLARFDREAKALAALSHANIAQIYGLENIAGSADPARPGAPALVMELAAGEDLTVRVQRGAMTLQEALPIATQIALALEAAHERSIIHRDLKPANIKVSDDGAVKVLDFGLAKALDPAAASGASNASNSPTLTAQATAAGIILGTAAYMSPEQARGRDADKRADIWAFGVVFFEMLTGRRLFQGETISDTLAAVLRQDIPWAALPAGTPGDITKLLRRCLERDRKNRLHDIADARIVLEEVARGGTTEDTAPVAALPAAKRPQWLLPVAALLMLVVGFASGRWTAPAPAAPGGGSIRLVIPTPPDVTALSEPAVAPDGSFVVFVGASAKDRRLYLQRLDEAAPRPIAHTEGASRPIVSPDNRWVAYYRGQRLEKIAVDGSDPISLADLARSSGPGLSWVPGGPILFSVSWLSTLSAVSPEADGSKPKAVSTLDTARGEIGHWFPHPLPDGRHVLMTVWTKATGVNDAEIAVLDLTTGRHTVLFKGAEGRFVAPGYIVYFRAGAYHAIRFDPATRSVSGDPVRVLDDAAGQPPEGDDTQTDLSATGTLAYMSGPAILPRELAWITEGGAFDALPFPARPYFGVGLAPEGRRVAAAVLEAGRYLLRVLDIDRRTDTALDLPGSSWSPFWAPDGKRLAFATMRKGDFDTYMIDLSSAAPPAPVLVTDFDESPSGFMPDGSLIVRQSESDGRYREKRMTLAPVGPLVTLIPFEARMPVASPDGKFLAFASARSGTSEIYVRDIDPNAAPEKVSTAGGTVAGWSTTKKELLYLREPDIIAVPYTIENGRLRAGPERVWSRVDGNYNTDTLIPARDGRVLVALDRKQPKREIRVIVNWQHEIAKKVK